jgi:hypothetical protein
MEAEAGTNQPPIRLAILADTESVAAAADLLTERLSHHPELQLVERNEVQRIYREQAISTIGTDSLKLGRLLGADGLCVLNTATNGKTILLHSHLIAIKSGVILDVCKAPWPMAAQLSWAETTAQRYSPWLPKLRILPQDALPISIVNVRIPTQNPKNAELEQILKDLIIERLIREPRLFVLERQRMPVLEEEKALNLDDSAFWSGSYLLEAAVDQNGASLENLSILCRLKPPQGRPPLEFEITSGRTNLPGAASLLGDKVARLLKLPPDTEAWSSTDEAEQFFRQASWAFKWKDLKEAQAAADSAWTLGKKDPACAELRIEAYLATVLDGFGGIGSTGWVYVGRTDKNGKALALPARDLEIQNLLRGYEAAGYAGIACSVKLIGQNQHVHSQYIDRLPPLECVNRTTHVIDLYRQFAATLPGTNLDIGSRWHSIGVEVLSRAGEVLMPFSLWRELDPRTKTALHNLRSAARELDQWLSSIADVRNVYYSLSLADSHERSERLHRFPSIYACQAAWGGYWRETPEDGVTMYRELLGSPAFGLLHERLWKASLMRPPITGWDAQARARIPGLWNQFLSELGSSTNLLWKMEGLGLAINSAESDANAFRHLEALMALIRENREQLASIPAALFTWQWSLDQVWAGMGNGSVLSSIEKRWEACYAKELSSLSLSNFDCHLAAKMAQEFKPVFERQLAYVTQTPAGTNDFPAFAKLFLRSEYSREQAAELLPRLTAYRSNLTLILGSQTNTTHPDLQKKAAWLVHREEGLKRQIQSPPSSPKPDLIPSPVPQPVLQIRQPPAQTNNTPSPAPPQPQPPIGLVEVSKAFKLPLASLQGHCARWPIITAHHYQEDKLLFDLSYTDQQESAPPGTQNRMTWGIAMKAIATFDPVSARWDVLDCLENPADVNANWSYYRTCLFHGDVYCSDFRKTRRFDARSRQWLPLGLLDGENYGLASFNGHLYGVSATSICEIADEGKTIHLLASARREPHITGLDARGFDVNMALLPGPDGGLRIRTPERDWEWTRNNWRALESPRPALRVASSRDCTEIFEYAGLFLHTSSWDPAYLYCLRPQDSKSVLWLKDKNRAQPVGSTTDRSPDARNATIPPPLWVTPDDISLIECARAVCGDDLYLLADRSQLKRMSNKLNSVTNHQVLTPLGYHSELLRFTPGWKIPQRIRLRFDAPDIAPPVSSFRPATPVSPLPGNWMVISSNWLCFGLENSGSATAISYVPGIWVLPMDRLAPLLQTPRNAIPGTTPQLPPKEDGHAAALLRFDLNHNGIIEPDERELRMNSEEFIKAELSQIDTNRNGMLDVEELGYFDTNTNGILDERESAGIEICLRIMALRLLREADANENGILERDEFLKLVRRIEGNTGPGFSLRAPTNLTNAISQINSYLHQHLRRSLIPRELLARQWASTNSQILIARLGSAIAARKGSNEIDTLQKELTETNRQACQQAQIEFQQLFKQAVENRWKKEQSETNLHVKPK